ncbi:glutamate-ammonia-ligase adenylyltransferase [Tamaricihabitans halophyticus]|uniref:Bifunctional glutamine synthetase adenylyltransferase/adenylyl-removing enzyme n=1 Tax=Tamaricihabitans halophyticus TaxID=1262583 RepID=A0A4R2Q4T2_9PSEU|nr:glutamate-ammonia-ligase adenylyltransferase [Tamaricihabitans halophyticus]
MARYGLTGDQAETMLAEAGWWGPVGPTPGNDVLLAALSRSPDPDLALRGLDRLREALTDWTELRTELVADSPLRARLFGVLGSSTALADHLVANPAEWRRLLGAGGPGTVGSPREDGPREDGPEPADPETTGEVVADGATGGRILRRGTRVLLDAIGADPDADPATARAELTDAAGIQALRAAYRGLLLDIAAADLAHLIEPTMPDPGYAEIAGALTELAEAALIASLAVSRATVLPDASAEQPRLAVLAMGKCGGQELNYVSDVDVVFVGEGDLVLAARLASTMMQVAGKACFEVDAALRPEGKAGELVRSMDGYASYYRRWARTWEFQALLKARPIAGDRELGARYLTEIWPQVWTAANRDNLVGDVQQMRRKVERHLPSDIAGRELKLGPGGLRDVEFAVQLLQLVHGRNDPQLRVRATLGALRALAAGGYVGRADATELCESYQFLRTVEHRLQLQRLRRTHLLPAEDDAAELRWLARASGVVARRGRSAGAELQAEVRRHAGRIRRLHEKLFYRPLLEAVSRVPSEGLRLTTEQALERLAALGYAAPDGALHHIKALTEGMSRRASIQRTLLPVLLDLLAETPDPDRGLLAYRRVSEELANTPWYLRVLRDEGAVAQNLATVLGAARFVPDLLIRAPEVLRLLGQPDELAHRDPSEVARSLRRTVGRHHELREAVASARSLRRHELARVSCADLLGLMSVPEVCLALSSVWIAVLDSALEVATRVTAAQWGSQPARIAVLGMGRLGGGELGYGSDADVLFVCEPSATTGADSVGSADSTEAVRFASAVAEQVRKALGGPSQDPALQVDADLRPEGRNGPLVRTLDSYLNYYRKWGDVWEHQALLRARYVAGDAELAQRFITAIEEFRYPAGGVDEARAREVRRIKARVDTERLPRGADPKTHTKLGRGGLADVEWTIQLLQLQHADQVPALRTTSTIDGLRAAAEADLLDRQDAEALETAWLLATRVRNVATLVRGKPTDQVPTSGRELAAVALIVDPDADDPGEFLDSYRRTTRQARTVVERVFYQS